MAEPLRYVPHAPPAPQREAEQELAQLLRTLHETGTLTLLNALVGQLSDVSEVLAGRLNTPPGRQILGNITAVGGALSLVPAEHVHALLQGVASGLELTQEQQGEKPPGLFRLAARMRHEDARRGLHVLITLLEAVGHQLAPAEEQRQPSDPDGQGS